MSDLTTDEKQEIDRLINVFLNGLTSISKDAGWQGDSLLSRVIEFAGCPPMPSGYDQSNMAMINAIRFLSTSNPDFPRIQAAVKAGMKFNEKNMLALLAKHFYRGLSSRTERVYTDEERAMLVGQDLRSFRHNCSEAYKVVCGELERIDLFFAHFYATAV